MASELESKELAQESFQQECFGFRCIWQEYDWDEKGIYDKISSEFLWGNVPKENPVSHLEMCAADFGINVQPEHRYVWTGDWNWC